MSTEDFMRFVAIAEFVFIVAIYAELCFIGYKLKDIRDRLPTKDKTP